MEHKAEMEILFTRFLEKFLENYVKEIEITLDVLISTIYQWADDEPISVQCCIHIETSHLICSTNKVTDIIKTTLC